MSRPTRDGTAEPVSRDQILRRERRQGDVYFPCSPDHEQDWQLYPVVACSTISDHNTIFFYRSTICRKVTVNIYFFASEPQQFVLSLPSFSSAPLATFDTLDY